MLGVAFDHVIAARLAKPDGCDLGNGVGSALTQVEITGSVVVDWGGDRVDDVDEVLTPTVDDLFAHERCDVLRRLQP